MQKIPKVILLIETSREFGRGLLRGIAKYVHFHGPWAYYREPMFYMNTNWEKKAISRMKSWNADGIIMRERKDIDKIIAMGLPTIVSPYLKGPIPDLPNIIGDDFTIGKMGAEHLLERGFRYFAYCGFDNMFWSQKRAEGFGSKIAQAGFQTYFYKQPKKRSQRLWENEQYIMANWLKSLPKPVGLMACDDDRSQQVVEACKIAGLHIPDQVAIIGVDNDELVCELSNPPLSSIVQNAERAGYEAAELLDRMMEGKKVTNKNIIVQATHIVTRQSTDILAIKDPCVVNAIRFIRQNANKMLQVRDVVEASGTSRRSLEQRFHQILGRSIYKEIKRVRIEKFTRMLVETNLSISQIASDLNYPSIEHVSRSFRKEKGMTPLAYRKRYGHK